jgi:hypothetical protein
MSRTSLGLSARSRCNRAMASPLSAREAIFVDPRLLAQAPELAALALLDVALEPLSLRLAQRLLSAVCPLQRAVHRYRAVVVAATRVTTKEDDDLPF